MRPPFRTVVFVGIRILTFAFNPSTLEASSSSKVYEVRDLHITTPKPKISNSVGAFRAEQDNLTTGDWLVNPSAILISYQKGVRQNTNCRF